MDDQYLNRIRNNPHFQELERKRNSFSWTLAVLMIAIYAVFIGLVAFDPSLMAQPIGNGPITLAFPLGLGVIAASIILTGLYVVRANSEFDRLTRAIVGDMETPHVTLGASLAGVAR